MSYAEEIRKFYMHLSLKNFIIQPRETETKMIQWSQPLKQFWVNNAVV